MAKSKHIGLTVNGLLTQQAIKAYVGGSLSEEQRKEFELLLENDPFAQDAIEGLKKHSTLEHSFSAVEDLKEKLRVKTGAGKKANKSLQIHWSVFAYVAALIAIVLGIGLIFMFYQNQPRQELAAVETIPVDTPSVTSVDTAIVSAPVDSIILPDTTNTITQESTNPDVTLAENVDVAGKMELSAAKNSSSISLSEESKKANIPAAAPTTSSARMMAKEGSGMAVTAKEAESKPAADDAKVNSSKSEFDQAMDLFTNGDYKNAETKFSGILSKSPDNSDAIYFDGVSNYINGNSNKAEQQFDKLIKKGIYTEGSKWYKANILLKKGKTDEAKELLRYLSNTNSVYKDRAVKKLDSLQ